MERIEKLRITKKITQYRICKDLNIPPSTYNTWVKEDRVPKADKLQKIADYFGVSLEYITTGKEPEVYTIAAHHDDYDFTEEELDEIEEFKKYVLSKRKK